MTKPMAGTIPSNEGHRSSAALVSPNSQPQANGAQHADILPVTKFPALDTIDPYAVDRSLGDVVANSPLAELLCSADGQDVANDLIQGYARFISNFTGLEDVAYLLSRYPTLEAVSEPVRDVVCASVFWSESAQRPGDLSTCTIRHVDERLYNKDEIQFSLDLGANSEPENGEKNLSSVQENHFKLRIKPTTNNSALAISFTYPKRLIPDQAVQQVLNALAACLASSSTFLSLETPQPELSIINFPSLTIPPSIDSEQNGDAGPSSSQRSLLHAAFEGWARRKPNAIALDFVHSLPSSTSDAEHSILTYAALDNAASKLATHIRACLASSNSADYGRIIPVYMTTSPELYISYLGILKAGCAFSPIPQDAPAQRVLEILEDINSPIILGNSPEPSSCPWQADANQEVQYSWVDVAEVTGWKQLRGDQVLTPASDDQLRELDIQSDQTAYLLFTSGSTGKPKGVQVSHLAGACSIHSHATTIPLPGNAIGDFRWFQFASPTFDPSLMEIFVTLSCGATLCSADRSLTLTDLETTISEARATVMMATPSLAALLRPSRLTTLESLWTMGEKLNRTVIENFAAQPNPDGASRMLVNAYGPTEGAINCTFLAPFGYSIRGSIIGKELPTCAMFVLDPNSHEPKAVPAGLTGELAIGGPQVSKGYLNRPKETAKSFVHSSEFGYLYRTGDMARIVWDETGSQVIEFLGRITSDQVKISGRRLELSEVESVVATVADVTEIVTVVSKRDNNVQGSEQIVACLVAPGASEAKKQDILREAQETAQRHLSSYMCPSAYTFFDSLPRSSSGKVDRKAIAAKLQQGEQSGLQIYGSPKSALSNGTSDDWEATDNQDVTSTQDLVIQLISETTEEDSSNVKAGADLYSLGIDSLGAMRLLQKLRDHSIEGLAVADVLQSGTPKGLVSIILERRQLNGNASANGIQSADQTLRENLQSFSDRNIQTCAERLGLTPENIQSVLPTTATQSGMLASFLRSSADKSFATRSYIYHSVLPLEPEIDIERIKTAWQTTVANYDSFRTVFCWLDDDMAPFAQCLLDNQAVPESDWSVYDAPAVASSGEEEILNKALRNAEDTINLSTPPWKLSLVKSADRTLIILSMFHGIFDGGSLELLLEDVSSVYAGKQVAKRTSLEHIVKHHFSADHDATSQFWSNHLDQYSPVVFPSVTPYRALSTKTTDRVEIVASTSCDDLKKQSKSIGSTPLAVLQAAWGSVLLAYTGTPDQDVVMGSVVSGRLDPESEICIGPTFTTVPIRLAVNQVKQESQGVWTNKSVTRHLTALNAQTLSHLQPRLGSLVTADGRLPYDTLLAYQDFNAGSSSSGIWSSIDHPPMANDFAVMIEVWPGADSSLTFRASFNDAHLDSKAAEAMLKSMADIVAYILGSPDGNYQDASSHTQPELKSSFNPGAKVVDEVLEGALIHTRFEDHAESHPDDLALIFKGDLDDEHSPLNITWTYAQLNAIADDLAEHLLQAYGPLTNTPVPICIEKSPALYVAILGILKAGGAWCPIDTLSPAQRRHDLIARTDSKVLLVSSNDGAQPEGCIPAGVDVVDVHQFSQKSPSEANGLKRNNTKQRSNPDSMAYLIWTSGTTGAPKGVPIKHSAAVSSMKSLFKDIPQNADGSTVRCMQFSQYTFDVSIQDFFYTWGLGGVLISASREIMLGSFPKLANLTKATHAHLTPAFSAGIPRKSCETLKVITMIGEKLTQPVADDWGTDMRAFNTYGPAEVTIVSTVREFGNEHKNVKSANIGWPMDTVSVFVTKNQRMVMKNAVGELALGGPQLSPGYLNQDDVTKAKYVWNEEAGQILYYTGDLVRMLADGSLEYINRVDDLVKLGGIRVELSEISFSLGDCHPLIENIETLILSRPDRPSKVVVSFLSAPGAAGPEDEGQLLILNDKSLEVARSASDQAQATLPDHMIPSVYLVVKNIPRTPSAKTDRRALQTAYAEVDIDKWDGDLNPENGAIDQSSEDPADAAAAANIVNMIALLADISPSIITKASRLGSLGIDSIRAIRLASRLKEAGHQISVVEVLNCVTVQDLIKLASTADASKATQETFDLNAFNSAWHDVVSAKVQDEFSTVRATTIQESLLSETMGTYNMYWSNHFFSLDQSLDINRLKQAWFSVCQKTEALRTGFIPVAEVDIGAKQQNSDFSMLQLMYKLPDVDWQHLECNEQNWVELRDTRIEQLMQKHQSNYFKSPPWAVTVLDKGDERTMFLTIHHSIHDGPSLGLIMDDVRSAYAYKPPSRHQLSDALSITLPTEQKSKDTRSFWASELEKFSGLEVPVWPDLTGIRLQPGEVQEHRFIAEECVLSEPVSKLQAAAAQLGVSSIASIIRAAWGFVSVGYLSIPATVFAETLSDRVLHADLEDNVGPLISVVPIPFHPQGTVRELLAEQHRLSVQSWKHRHIHARDVRKMLNRPRGEPLYPAVFNFHVAGDETKSSQPQTWQELEDQIGLHVEHPMAMNVFQRADGSLVLEASSDIALMNKHQLSLFVRQIDALVSAMLQFPDEQVSNLGNHVTANLRSVSNRPVTDLVANSIYTSPTYWLELNAREHPEWTAVEVATNIAPSGIEKEIMTYGTLNAEANRVAAFIASFGHKNRMIAVCCGRNIPSYPVIIGIFKSGNTYLPIDEGLPADRKAFLIEDGDCPLVFTESTFSASFSRIPETCQIYRTDDPEYQKLVAPMPAEDRDYQSHPDDLSYLLFTSGSTGKPKGVMVTRANLSSFIESFTDFIVKAAPRTLTLGGTGRHLAQASRAFDPHLVEMFFPWRQGMATVTAPRTMILDDLQVTLGKWEITHASFVPSLVDQANILPEHCPKLVYMSVGGEKISQKVLDAWATSHIALANAYGPTEVTIGCTFAHVGRDTNLRNIGPPLTACVCHVFVPGTQTYALKGQTGELCFTGDLVAKGYLNRPDATGFTTGPNGERMYRTGDIGRLMFDDSVEYLGRGDDQTKIRGQRLELGEVSEVLRSSSTVGVDVVTSVAKHPGLSRVQLISFIARSDARQRQKGGEVAFVQSDFATLGKELQEICKKKLPGYMVPELILPITYIPLAPMSGKANLKDLHALFFGLPLAAVLQGNNAGSIDGTANTRPLTADEEAVVKEICSVISIDSSAIGPLTNIFEVGLDSLSAIGLSIKLRKIGYAATVALVMSNPVIEQLAHLPRTSSSSNSEAVVSKLRQNLADMESSYRQNAPTGVELSTVASIRPCLPLQEGLVARSINNEGDQLYINHIVLRLEDNVDTAQLRSAWQTVARDNEIMRTSFSPLEKEVVQVVFSADSHEVRWEEDTYESLDESTEKLRVQQAQISRDIITNISTVPPVRFHLAKSSSTNQPLALFISIHHALYDGESFSMLLEDVAAQYVKAPVPQRGAPAAFIEHVYTQDTEKAKKHWTEYLGGCRPTLFRTDFNFLEHPQFVSRTLGNKLSDLERRSASLQTTVPSLVQAIFGLLLADAVGVSDVTYGLVLSGRAVAVPGADSVILPCITTIPGRLNTNDLTTVTEVVERVQKSTVRSLEFQHTSLRHMQRWLKSETPLFDCLFSYIRATTPSQHNIWRELDSQMPAEYPLAVEVEANSSTDSVNLNCAFSSIFSAAYNGEEFLEKMDAVLSSVVSGEILSLDNFNLPQSEGTGSRSPATQWDETTWSATETKIREMTKDFCGLSLTDVTKGASFISLGIDSVTAIQFSRRLREAGLNASSSDVMRFSCVGALAQHVDVTSGDGQTLTNGANGTKRAAIPADVYQKHVRLLGENDSVSAVFECTPLQSGMITQTLGSAGQVYVHPHPVRLADSVDIAKLKNAVSNVILSNDILRTSFHLIAELGHSWIGAVHTQPPFEWKEISLPSDADALSEVSALFSFAEESSFEIPPIRTVLVDQPEGKLLVVVMHHALYDGASLPFFFEDLAMGYSGDTQRERPQFSETVEHILNGQEDSCKFWTEKLLGYEAVEVPQLPSDQASDRMFLSEHRVDLDLPTIIESCKSMEVTVQSIALLAYAKVLARVLGKRDVAFGQVLAGRSLPTPGAERTLGPLFNTVAQRVTFEPKFLSNKAMASRLQQLTADAQVYQHAPLRVVQNSLRQANELTSTSLFDTLFVFQKSADFAGGILETQEIWKPYETEEYAAQAEYKLNVEVDHSKDGIVARASCNGQHLSQQNLDDFMAEFGSVFRDIIEHPTRCATVLPERLGELPLRLSVSKPQEESVEDSEAPPHEAIVQSVLAEVAGLSVDNIKPNTSIFSIGLDSLSAIRIASICRSKGVRTGVADILQGNTLRGISQRVRPMEEQTVKPQGPLIANYERTEEVVVEKLGLQKEAIETILPCLGGQFYHLVSWLRSGRKLFEPAWPYFSSERIDTTKLEDAWYQLRQRHPVLRTCFAAISSSEAVQVIMKEAVRDAKTFKVINSSATITEAAQAQAKEEALNPSSLFVPPVRLRLLKASDRDGILVLVNHAAYDAWTMPMFVSELESIYRGQPLETNSDFASFVDFSVRSLRDLDEKTYWTSAIGSGERTVIKNAAERNGSQLPDQVFVGAWEKVKNVSQLETLCRSAGISLQTVVLLAVARCLARMTGVNSPTMGLYQTGRSASFTDIEKLTGPCLNVNPFTVSDAVSDSSLLDKAQAVQASLAERVSFEQSSLWDVLRWAGAEQTGTPLFNAWVNLLWMQNAMPSVDDATPEKELTDNGDLFLPLRIGVPTDFIPVEPLAGLETTSVSELDTSLLPSDNVYIDIGPDPKTDTIGFGVRVEGGLLAEEEVHQLVNDVASEIEAIVSSLQ
ncbi:non-ribosomal peptide synthetase/alpha-aminoadipate reductase [Aspergillus steynii IBT 23096]|uniref:Nonribosomal peptide synthetase sidC n=1 Tax=Aspergillus steynii IBT 23096 TaxID=1392250 RepID=A0A2I2FV45_9EURO|nr:non-ribosomal peptide synthetase/alpha-aminoadipate reductase [Aspergillus steynii IBT 23096]PLB44515.1 non-ribosomal peptide synthetase/alpha-aminoadipate reductase [Aspergillus steynii IBT 23096]